MTWTAFRTRGEILRAVADEADLRCDGALPWDLPDVAQTFRDELDLVAALQLRWYTRLAGQIERHLVEEPTDLEASVRRAWGATADDLPGIRAILDRETADPSTPEIGTAMAKAVANEHSMLALMAGLAGTGDRRDPRAVAAGRQIEVEARASYRPGAPMPVLSTERSERVEGPVVSSEPTVTERASAADVTAELAVAAPTEAATKRVPTGSAAFVARLKAALAA